jgi:polysaccharide biosynthesis transport protein
MDLSNVFQLLSRRKWYIILPAIMAAIATFYLVQQLPKKYLSAATLATGIVDFKSKTVGGENTFVQQFQIESRFNNLTEDLVSRPSIKLLAMELMQHDLQNPSEAFHKPNWKASGLFNEQTLKNYAVEHVILMDSIKDPLNPTLNTAKALELEKVFGYDYMSLVSNFKANRVGKSDYVRIDFLSDRADLSYFMVDKYIDRYLDYHYNEENTVETSSVDFYSELAETKKARLDSLVLVLNGFKQNRLIVNLEDQGKAVVSQLKDLELAREDERKNIEGYNGSIANLETRIQSVNREFNNEDFATAVFMKDDVKELGDRIEATNKQWIDGGMRDASLKKRAEALREERAALAKKYASTPREKDNRLGATSVTWLEDQVDLENKRMIANSSVKSLDREISRLRNLKSSLVSSNSYIGNIEQDVILAQDDYTNTVNKLEISKLNYKDQERPLRVVERPLQALGPESNKASLLSIFAGLATAILGSIIVFLLAFMDKSFNNPYQFKKFTNLPVLGVVNRLPKKLRDLNYIFGLNGQNKEAEYFKETLRKMRLEIEDSGAKVFLFTSTKRQEGKSFLIVSLAYTLGLKDKKVLIIDTNFKNNTLTLFANGNAFGQPINENAGKHEVMKPGLGTGLSINAKLYNVDIIGNKLGSQSPSEILNGTNFNTQLKGFLQRYDYIFLEAADLNRFSDARELVAYADKIIPVFDAESRLSSADEESLRFLQNQNGKMLGAVLNGVPMSLVHNN